MSPIKVLIVDDSAVVRQVLSATLTEDVGIEVIGTASDPIFAMDKMAKAWPDVIVLDVEMPRMDGITFLRKIMAERPTPVVICSTLTEKGAETTMQAMSAGAVGIVTKPKMGLKQYLQDASCDLVGAVKAAARANPRRLAPTAELPKVQPKLSADTVISAGTTAMAQTTDRVVAIGTSTGGTQALEVVLRALPRVCPGIIVVQHMPEKFTEAFARRLDGLCQMEVREATNGDRVRPGLVLIAPGGRHMLLKRSGAQYHVDIIDGPPVSRHRPSVDVLFRSVAKFAGRNALGIIMTGMGDDGARGLKEMHDAGAHTLAQDEETCVVYGMPKEAVKLGAVNQSLPLDKISSAIMHIPGAGQRRREL
ncbi:protein-glutamate methylesterase/protein-glutamine glutaminase [Nitrincola sp. MINF-07-Sa-05]|uniref:protein-glutamate methylesterase/protein-glutamine glutaminase n=1 Tax=Nitrincola salilacus TaxID=3400273 RepID=UPI00391805FA